MKRCLLDLLSVVTPELKNYICAPSHHSSPTGSHKTRPIKHSWSYNMFRALGNILYVKSLFSSPSFTWNARLPVLRESTAPNGSFLRQNRTRGNRRPWKPRSGAIRGLPESQLHQRWCLQGLHCGQVSKFYCQFPQPLNRMGYFTRYELDTAYTSLPVRESNTQTGPFLSPINPLIPYLHDDFDALYGCTRLQCFRWPLSQGAAPSSQNTGRGAAKTLLSPHNSPNGVMSDLTAPPKGPMIGFLRGRHSCPSYQEKVRFGPRISGWKL